MFDQIRRLICGESSCPTCPEYGNELIARQYRINELSTQLAIEEKRYADALTHMTLDQQTLQNQLQDAQDAYTGLNARYLALATASSAIPDYQKLLAPETISLLETYWDRYAEADAEYTGRYVGSDKRNVMALDVKIFALEGQNDNAITERVKAQGCRVSDIMVERDVGFHRACDIAMMRVQDAFCPPYQSDSSTWGTSEFWMFASETLALGSGDCEDIAILRYVAARAAGIPQAMLRIAAGETYGGEGHATNYYFASDLKWHHVNSTSRYGRDVDMTILPQTHDEKDLMGLKWVWFAFTESKTWHDLTTDDHATSFMRAQRDELRYHRIKVKGLKVW